MRRGECEFVFKALNAEQLGAELAIVMDNQKHDKIIDRMAISDKDIRNCKIL